MTASHEDMNGSRPTEQVSWSVAIHAPDKDTGKWWIREDLVALFRQPIRDALSTFDHGYDRDENLLKRLTISVDGPIALIQADNKEDILAFSRWIAYLSDPRDRDNWSSDVQIEAGAARLQRPLLEVPATFEALIETWGRVSRSHVPIEAVRRGDKQVVAACYPGRGTMAVEDPVVSLDSLANFPEVFSVIAATPVHAQRPLPSIRELLLLHRVALPDAHTLRNLGCLEVFLSLVPPYNCKLELDAFPQETPRRIAVSASCIERLDPLGRMTNLEELRLYRCMAGHSLKVLANLTGLRRVHIDGESRISGWNALRHCTLLEEAQLVGLKANDLRSFRAWTRLRRLGIARRGLGSLAGIGALTELEELTLAMVAIDDLGPLGGHRTLNTLVLNGTKGIRDLGPLAELPRLRRLEMSRAGSEDSDVLRVRSLRPLARCESLESLSLDGTIVDDADLASLADLPKLQRLKIVSDDGSLTSAISSLRRQRPDIDIDYQWLQPLPGEKLGGVTIHQPEEGLETWWIRDDLTDLLKASTNYDAEKKLRRVLAAENRRLLKRLEFDSEASAVVVHARDEDDIRGLAEVINRLAAPSR